MPSQHPADARCASVRHLHTHMQTVTYHIKLKPGAAQQMPACSYSLRNECAHMPLPTKASQQTHQLGWAPCTHLDICMGVHYHPQPAHHLTRQTAGKLQLSRSNKALRLLHNARVQRTRHPGGGWGVNQQGTAWRETSSRQQGSATTAHSRAAV